MRKWSLTSTGEKHICVAVCNANSYTAGSRSSFARDGSRDNGDIQHDSPASKSVSRRSSAINSPTPELAKSSSALPPLAQVEESRSENTSNALPLKKSDLEQAKVELAAYEKELLEIQAKIASAKDSLAKLKIQPPSTDRPYPALYASIVKESSTEDSHDALKSETASVYCLCEFQFEDDNGSQISLLHPVKQAKAVPSSDFIGKLSPHVYATNNIVQLSSTLQAVAEVKIADSTIYIPQASINLLSVISNKQESNDAANSPSLTVQGLFGDVVDGKVSELEKVVISTNGPFGGSGSSLWLCPEHSALVSDWKKDEAIKMLALSEAAKAISSNAWNHGKADK